MMEWPNLLVFQVESLKKRRKGPNLCVSQALNACDDVGGMAMVQRNGFLCFASARSAALCSS